MPSHKIKTTQLQKVDAALAKEGFSTNELTDLWKRELDLDIFLDVGRRYLAICKSPNVSNIDKHKAGMAMATLVLQSKRATITDRSGAVQVNIITNDPTKDDAIDEKNVTPA